MIAIEDSNNETYFINPRNVVYVKKRNTLKMWKIMLIGGEVIMTKNKIGIESIITGMANK